MSSDQVLERWSITKNENYFALKLSGDLPDSEIHAFETALLDLTKGPQHFDVIVHCGDLADLPMAWIRSLLALQKQLKTTNKNIRLINAPKSIVIHLKEQGLISSLPCSPSLREALVGFGLVSKKTLDVGFINPFLTATMHVLKIQASTESSPGKIELKEENQGKFSGDISGVIGLVSDAFTGSVVITFPKDTFLQIMTRMLGEPVTEINKDTEDGAAELTNMIFGQAKVALNEKGYGLKTAIPSVVTGQNHSVQSLTAGPQVLVPFTTDVGKFFIEICTSG